MFLDKRNSSSNEGAADHRPALSDWNKMMAELFSAERRSMLNSTPDSSSGVVSDDHYPTISDHSESINSPRRGFRHRQPPTAAEDQRKVRPQRLTTTPSPTMHYPLSVNHDLSPTSKPAATRQDFPIYQNLPLPSAINKQTEMPHKSAGRLKKQIKSMFQLQSKIIPPQPPSRNNHPMPIRNKKITFSERLNDIEEVSSAQLNDLDDRLVTKVFKYLSSNELCNCALVSMKWYELVWNPCLWSHIVIDNRALDVDRGIKCLTTALSYDQCKTCLIVESIDLTGCRRLTDRGLYLIAERCPKLKELLLDGCHEVTNIAIFEIVSRCTDLESLSLSGCQYVTCISLTPEANLQAVTWGKQVYLNHLDMTDCFNVDDTSLQMIVTYCSKLSFLYLRRCVKITDIGVQYAASYCCSLQELSVSDCPNISDLGMKDISRLEASLRYLSVAKCRRISDAGLRCVARNCTKLRYLNARGCDRLTQDGVVFVATYCRRLRSLDLGSCNLALSDESLESLGGCDQLRRLSLKGCTRFSDSGIISLAQKCRQLQQLNLIECRISSRALDAIHRFCPSCIVEHSNPGLL